MIPTVKPLGVAGDLVDQLPTEISRATAVPGEDSEVFSLYDIANETCYIRRRGHDRGERERSRVDSGDGVGRMRGK